MTTRRPKTGEPAEGEGNLQPSGRAARTPVPIVPAGRALIEALQRRFLRPELLTLALTHRSLAYETMPAAIEDPQSDNEQLEFLGDAILGMVVAESLYRRFPNSREGELTRLRASLVSRVHLGEVGRRMDLGSALLLGRGEEGSGGRGKPALLANALEAVIAAMYLDGGPETGLPAVRSFVEEHVVTPMLPALDRALRAGDAFSGAIGDHKSALQEHLQGIGAGQPLYILTAQSGPDHDKRFRIQVRVEDGNGGSVALSECEGTTKKKAQQEAARLAFEQILAGTLADRLPAQAQSGDQP